MKRRLRFFVPFVLAITVKLAHVLDPVRIGCVGRNRTPSFALCVSPCGRSLRRVLWRAIRSDAGDDAFACAAVTTGVWRDDIHPASVWAGDMTDQGYPNARLELEIYADGTGVLRTEYG